MKISTLAVALALTGTTCLAQDLSSDGRTGPVAFDDAALNTAMAQLNGFLQDRYVIDDAMAQLWRSGELVAKATEVPEFGPMITGDTTLDATLVALSEDLDRTSRAVEIVVEMTARVAGDNGFGPPVSNGATLDASLRSLSASMTGMLPIFAQIAALSAETVPADGAFGPLVSDGRSLNRQITALNIRLDTTPIPERIVSAMRQQTDDGRETSFGPLIADGPSLGANLRALADQMVTIDNRAVAITGRSFDFYTGILALY